MTLIKAASLLVCALGLWACGSTTSQSPDMAQAPDLATMPDLTATPDLAYPAGPYGVDVGSVLADWVGNGYRLTPASMDVTKTPFEPIALSSFRSCRCLYIDLTSNCLPPCRSEWSMVNDYMAGSPAAGFCPLEITLDDYATNAPATKSFLDGYLTRNPHAFPVVILDAPAKARLPNPMAVPHVLVVNPATMTILSSTDGFSDTGIADALTACGL